MDEELKEQEKVYQEDEIQEQEEVEIEKVDENDSNEELRVYQVEIKSMENGTVVIEKDADGHKGEKRKVSVNFKVVNHVINNVDYDSANKIIEQFGSEDAKIIK